MSHNTKIYLNNIATRSFRDVADQDYIAARACFRSALTIQFDWLAHQAVEKYFKSILLYNKVSTKNLGHDLMKSLTKIREIDNMRLDLTEPVLKFIKYLNEQGPNRYLEKSHYTIGNELHQLDEVIWQIRRYCKVLNYDITLRDGTVKNMFNIELNTIHHWLKSNSPHEHMLISGHLEKVIKNHKSPQRANLIWQNIYFGKRKKTQIKYTRRMVAINPTHVLHPEMFDELEAYVQFPKEIKDKFRDKRKVTKT